MTLEIMDFEEYQKKQATRLQNPLLLGVKMFLADVIYLSNMRYDRCSHNCSNFSMEVQEAATKQGIRCGYVVISWVESEISHAIVAFETDYGLKFFEPQLAEEEDVIIGRRYSVCLSADVNNKIIG